MRDCQISIMPLGGVRENGKDLYVVEINQLLFVLDCGLSYPEDEMLGIDAVIPDFTYLLENRDRLAGIFLSHGHEDAIGALPYLLAEVDVPVFGTDLTIELAKLNAKEAGLAKKFNDYHVIDEETEIEFDQVVVSFFKTTHTIPGALGVVLTTKLGSIVYTGNFKFDQSATPTYQTDFKRLADIGAQGVLALLSDSNNAASPVENASDALIAVDMLETFRNAEGRVIIAAIASNILRLQQVIEATYQAGRKLFITGHHLEEILDISLSLGYLTLPDKQLIVNRKQMNKLADNELVILETGGVGKPLKSLRRMALGRHPQCNIKKGDLIYMATSPATNLEVQLARTKDMIYRKDAEVVDISHHFKASGHATPNELRLLLNLIQPRYVIPVQGEYRMLLAHAEIAHELGYDYKDIIIPGKGEVIHVNKKKISITSQIPAGNVLVDGRGVGDIGNIVLKDRKILSEDGIFVAVLTISRRQAKILSGPQIISRGFVYMRASEDLLDEAKQRVVNVTEKHLKQDDFEWSKIKQDIRDELSCYLFEQTNRRPVVLPVIMEASNFKA